MLLARPICQTSIQYMDCIEIFNISLDLFTIYLLVLVGVELPLRVAVTQSQNAINLFSGVELSIRSFSSISSN